MRVGWGALWKLDLYNNQSGTKPKLIKNHREGKEGEENVLKSKVERDIKPKPVELIKEGRRDTPIKIDPGQTPPIIVFPDPQGSKPPIICHMPIKLPPEGESKLWGDCLDTKPIKPIKYPPLSGKFEPFELPANPADSVESVDSKKE